MDFIPFPEYDELTPEDKARIVNGCGPSGWKIKIVPDNILGVSIYEPCCRHDMGYFLGKDKDASDRDLLANIVTEIIKHEREKEGIEHVVDVALLKARLDIAVDFFIGVHLGGDAYFGKRA